MHEPIDFSTASLDELKAYLNLLIAQEQRRREAFEAGIQPLRERIEQAEIALWQSEMATPLHVGAQLLVTEAFHNYFDPLNDSFFLKDWPPGCVAVVERLRPSGRVVNIKQLDGSFTLGGVPGLVAENMRRAWLAANAGE